MNVEKLIETLEKKREQRIMMLTRVSRATCPRASSLNFECKREMYHSIVDWQKRKPVEKWLQERFEEGKRQEQSVIQELLQDGFNVMLQQKTIEFKGRDGKVILTGHIDGIIEFEDKLYPFEVKSLDPNIYDSIDGLEDFNKKPWMKKYITQLQTYLWGNNCEEGLFILTDCKGHRKQIVVKVDAELMERILSLCEEVVVAVDKNEPPAHCGKSDVCAKCWAFGNVCFPDINRQEMQIIDDDELESCLEKRETLIEQKSEYDALDKQIKDRLKGVTKEAICGNFIIGVKESTVNYKAKEAFTTTQRRVSIERLPEVK